MKKRRLQTESLALTTAGALELIPIGCGSAFSKKLYQNHWMIRKGGDHVMIDCGGRTSQALNELGLSVTDIEHWLITHSHADHIGGLEEVMLMNRYVARRRASIHIPAVYERTLWRDSLRGGSAPNERHDGRQLRFRDFWKIERPTPLDGYPRDTEQVTVGSIDLKTIRTRHFPEQAQTWRDSAYSVGVIVDDRVLFTGDTQFDPDLLESYDRLFNFETIFHDVQFFTGGIHAGLDELCGLPRSLKERIVLMHYPDSYASQKRRVRDEGFLGFAEQRHSYAFG
ncbi:MAG: MBL fold metallo-hydrolase [Spirochaetaceae bacterium]|nr:MAG: MBL fold metallo-hydrolase [Spirochaetaceae bacterium]